ncbi:hypothetical protein M427DRAFT_43259 [Gonapodya prolifera JEL478]|uniref:Uncharacterized protein n=1 Tax=Gonapodya prolifera (strain JEL478) TaxID=1344416 RepID=A0A139AJP9_GONPJ|nr:hypothetical protein M427DRAFT_43259 [Gonapodya prolifera JEL478]|eukprot:KXS16979.1 hypothetical protein M427DRAFT_43259 [Gonapodya prolifera JEL478]
MDLPNALDPNIPAMGLTQMQVLVNALALTGGVSQFIILIVFIPDLRNFPPTLRYLCIATLALFGLGNSHVSLGFVSQLGTYWLRIRVQSNKNAVVSAVMGVLVGAEFVASLWQCVFFASTGVMLCFCAPADGGLVGALATLANHGLLLLTTAAFLGLHVYYLRKHSESIKKLMESARISQAGGGGKNAGISQIQSAQTAVSTANPGMSRMIATMQLMTNSLSSMSLTILGTLSSALVTATSGSPLTLYALRNQVAQTFATVAYYRAFADGLRGAEMSVALASRSMVGAPQSSAALGDVAIEGGSKALGLISRRLPGESGVGGRGIEARGVGGVVGGWAAVGNDSVRLCVFSAVSCYPAFI